LYPVVTRDHFQAGLRALFRLPAKAPDQTGAAARRGAKPKPARAVEPAKSAEPAKSDEPAEAADPAAGDAIDGADGAPHDPGAESEEADAKKDDPRDAPDDDDDDEDKTATWYARSARRRCGQFDEMMRNMRAFHPGLEEDTYRALHDLVAEFEGEGVRVVLFTPPYYAAYNRCFDRRLQILMRENAQRIVHDTGAGYFDFSSTPEFLDDRSLFVNSDHLTTSGRAVFSELLGKAIAQKDAEPTKIPAKHHRGKRRGDER